MDPLLTPQTAVLRIQTAGPADQAVLVLHGVSGRHHLNSI
jgi:hypothetical protein